MEEYHEAQRQISYIKQALAQGHNHIGFLIGAGCPLSIRIDGKALLPDIAGLTKQIFENLTSGDVAKPSCYDRLCGLFVEDEFEQFTIEDALSMIRGMRQIAGKGLARTFNALELDQLDLDICAIISETMKAELPDQNNAYHDLAIWARSLGRDNPVHVFTTNYDMLLEEAFEEQSSPYFDGFTGTRRAFFDLGAVEDEEVIPARWTRLWKIHGSINWRAELDETGAMKSVIRSDDIKDGQKYLIYPSHLKYDQSRKMPYLALMDRLKSFLLSPNSVLITSGYSFGDEHINELIVSSLKSNPSAVVYALLHDKLDSPAYTKAIPCGMSTPNLVVAGKDAAIIGRKRADWKHRKSASEDAVGNGLIASLEEDDEEKDGLLNCEIALGDFAKLGLILRTMSSPSQESV